MAIATRQQVENLAAQLKEYDEAMTALVREALERHWQAITDLAERIAAIEESQSQRKRNADR